MIRRAGERTWAPGGFPGVEICPLHQNDRGGGAVLLRIEADASFPVHDHPGGEEALVIEGCVEVAGERLSAGDYLWTDAGQTHDLRAVETSLIYASAPLGIEIVK